MCRVSFCLNLAGLKLLLANLFTLVTSKCFGENISCLQVRANMLEINVSNYNSFVDIMVVYLYVFYPCMKP